MNLTTEQQEILIEKLQEAAAGAVFEADIPSCDIHFTLHNDGGWVSVELTTNKN